MPEWIGAAQAARRATGRILIGGCAAEPVAVLDAVAADPGLWRGRTLTGAFIPGVNDRDLSALGQGTTVETVFVTAGLRADRAAGRVAHLPVHYSAFHARLARPGVVDCVLICVPPPARDGTVGFGPACDFAAAAIAAGARLIGAVNASMPDVAGAPRLPLSRFEALVQGDAPLPTLAATVPDAVSRAIAGHIVGLLPPQCVLQLGLGKVQAAVLGAVMAEGGRDISIHGGMICWPVLDGREDGFFARGVVTGVALGDAEFYARLPDHPSIRYRPVDVTHGRNALAALPGFVSVNSVLQVDLTGQANGEYVGGMQVSGQGGMVDFTRGARASIGGRAILALPSTAQGGTVSRIVGALATGTPVSVTRADVDMVVTEHGIADLREADSRDPGRAAGDHCGSRVSRSAASGRDGILARRCAGIPARNRPMTAATSIGTPDDRPQYIRIGDVLRERIRTGHYPVDALMPTEGELCGEFSSSRHTVREALRRLTDAGLIARRQGSGSRVLASEPHQNYVHAMRSLDQLFQYASDTRFVIDEIGIAVPEPGLLTDGAGGALPDGGDGSSPAPEPVQRPWLIVSGLRMERDEDIPICHSVVLLNDRFAEVADDLRHHKGALYRLIEERFGVEVARVVQDITVAPMPPDAARALGAKPKVLAARVARRYLDAGGTVLIASVNHHPAERFSYSMELKRDATRRTYG